MTWTRLTTYLSEAKDRSLIPWHLLTTLDARRDSQEYAYWSDYASLATVDALSVHLSPEPVTSLTLAPPGMHKQFKLVSGAQVPVFAFQWQRAAPGQEPLYAYTCFAFLYPTHAEAVYCLPCPDALPVPWRLVFETYPRPLLLTTFCAPPSPDS